MTMIKIEFSGPILTGSISTAESRCGKANCICKANKPKLHGPYHRWTGVIDGKRTTKTITKEQAQECQKRIERYQKLKEQLDSILEKALKEAPWVPKTK